MKTIKNLILTVLTSAVLIVIVGLFFSSVNGEAVVPMQFFEARVKASDSAKNLAQLVDSSLLNLNKVKQWAEERKIAPALDLIQFELTNSKERQIAAITLSKSLEQMAHSTAGMSPDKAERLAVEAVSTGVNMVSQLINYNDLLNQLLVILQSKLNDGEDLGTEQISQIVNEMNSVAREINTLANKFNDLIESFDKKYID
ncbi:MAG: hypothetical protein COU10_02485 [Candidatus Harrisonbacteria bacterium CG10_big_fil_rev_8_21_14_0_10_45_28]|uniref:DUF5667 domain-containing protein n=1 Tax=Candidatus Harrisonbacteria bacterium CG10_big_fil_rev_8_21_14_0_10_45_28 TaxID=1974586 RepID=A0A2H0UN57_9BACT|nr:MAG: hypothetical protein COU10_02485 [Candidatus Harrisonbacteria bacterium CG10_big_fil_rev_8_21_14_0_10_45_28]